MKTIHHVSAIETLTIVDFFFFFSEGADPRTTDLSFCAIIWIKEIILTILLFFLNMRVFRCNNPPHGWQHLWNESEKLIYNRADLEKRHHTYPQCCHFKVFKSCQSDHIYKMSRHEHHYNAVITDLGVSLKKIYMLKAKWNSIGQN